MKKELLILCFFQVFFTFCQDATKCNSLLLNEKIDIVLNDKESILKFYQNLNSFENCGLDKDDINILLNTSFMVEVLTDIVANKESNPYTYKRILEKCMSIIKSDNYRNNVKPKFQLAMELVQRKASVNNWGRDKLILEKLQIPKEIINEIFTYIKTIPEKSENYEEILKRLQRNRNRNSQIKTTAMRVKNKDSFIFDNQGNITWEKILEKSKANNRRILIYFTGYACINAIKMENNILSDKLLVNNLKNNFHFVSLYVDDQTLLPQGKWKQSENKKRIIKTIGQRNSSLQRRVVNKNFQPYFVLMDSKGKLIRGQGYSSLEDFINFLK